MIYSSIAMKVPDLKIYRMVLGVTDVRDARCPESVTQTAKQVAQFWGTHQQDLRMAQPEPELFKTSELATPIVLYTAAVPFFPAQAGDCFQVRLLALAQWLLCSPRQARH